jgi:hypothetical protein
MHIFARLEEATLKALLDELLPVTILLDRSGKQDPGRTRWVSIQPTSHVDFVAGQGLRLITSGQIHWIVAGVGVDATLHSAQIMLRPEIVPEKHGGRLVFRPSLEAADMKNVPSWLDKGIVMLVNGQLESGGDELFWDFGHTLLRSVPMPRTLVGVRSLQLAVNNATVAVTANAFELTLTLGLHFQRPPAAG